MRRLLVFAVLAGVAFVIARRFAPQVHQRVMARCEGMFDRMPDDFPPKRMMRGIDEVQVTTARTLELLEATEGVRHSA